jgi:hypothetical protein
MYLMKLPEPWDMPERGLIMTEKWMKWKDWQKWKDRGMTTFSFVFVFVFYSQSVNPIYSLGDKTVCGFGQTYKPTSHTKYTLSNNTYSL